MKIATNGIVTNETGQVLLIQRDDSRTFAPPGGSVDIGELPTDNVTREVREETGLIVLPVRLVGLYFSAAKPEEMLIFVFRCTQRGGEIATSEESLQVDFFWPKPLPQPMLALHQERLEHGLSHAGGPPFWGRHRQTLRFRLLSFWLRWWIYPRMNRARERAGKAAYVPPSQWQATAVTLIQNKNSEILWRQVGNQWQLPGGVGQNLEAPWETAVRLSKQQINQSTTLIDLKAVLIHPQKPQLTLAFSAEIQGEAVPKTQWFAPGSEPENSDPQHREIVATAQNGGETAVFQVQKVGTHS